jgi:hypothetical protein
MALRDQNIECSYASALNYGVVAPCIMACEVEETGCAGTYTFSHSSGVPYTVDTDSITPCVPTDPDCGSSGSLLDEYGIYILAGGSLLFLLFALNKK